MGTRNLTVVILNKEVKVAQYGQWDGYPTGQGQTILEFILNKMDKNKFKEALSKCTFMTDAEAEAAWPIAGSSNEVYERFFTENPQYTRNTGAKILEVIQEQGGLPLINSYEFAADSLFCEYAYVLDMDEEVLEVYTGSNHRKVSVKQRFAEIPLDKKDSDSGDSKYYHVRIYKKYKFSELTPSTMKDLEQKIHEENKAKEAKKAAKKASKKGAK